MITIITPTYNRSHTLPNLYSSLQRQTSKEFEWIVIDDGSTDNTERLVDDWRNEKGSFEIIYIRQENGGKHRALNKGIPIAKYDYIYIVDSDDYLIDEAVECIHEWISTIKDKANFAGVSGLKGKINKNTEVILGQYPKGQKYVDATNLQRKRKKLLGDKAEVYRKALLLKYHFPEFEGEKFIGEAAVWDRIAGDGYKIRWFGKVICNCEYLEDGLTKNMVESIRLENFEGYTYIEKLNTYLRRFPDNLLAVGRYIDLAKVKKLGLRDVKLRLEINSVMLFSGIVFGFLRKRAKKLFRKY